MRQVGCSLFPENVCSVYISTRLFKKVKNYAPKQTFACTQTHQVPLGALLLEEYMRPEGGLCEESWTGSGRLTFRITLPEVGLTCLLRAVTWHTELTCHNKKCVNTTYTGHMLASTVSQVQLKKFNLLPLSEILFDASHLLSLPPQNKLLLSFLSFQ